ncbi:hypothetical protein GQX74_014901 [Glossina fuscipes]|nr:hypothetical protein GQX74_014901 [Glossina fuscipes]
MEDTLHGCNYTDERTKKNTCAYKTVLAFAVRSLMTAFIMLMCVRNTWEFRCRSTTRQSQTGEGDWTFYIGGFWVLDGEIAEEYQGNF